MDCLQQRDPIDTNLGRSLYIAKVGDRSAKTPNLRLIQEVRFAVETDSHSIRSAAYGRQKILMLGRQRDVEQPPFLAGFRCGFQARCPISLHDTGHCFVIVDSGFPHTTPTTNVKHMGQLERLARTGAAAQQQASDKSSEEAAGEKSHCMVF